jgi:hypothetical protein
MIQRIQSIYLLIVSVLMLFMLVLPMAEIAVERNDDVNKDKAAKVEEVVIFRNYGAKRYSENEAKLLISTFPVTILTVIIGLISFFNIFFYVARNTQMRICIFNILLLAGLTGLTFYYFTFIKKQIFNGGFAISYHSLKIAAIFPLISIVLTFLAFRSIRRDELLVRSYERLRK